MITQAARVTDLTSHGSPLGAGPGSSNVFVGNLPAWRALPGGVGATLEAACNAMGTMMSAPSLTPVEATTQLALAQAGFTQAASAAATQGSPAAPATTASAFAALNAANVSLTAAYTAACAVPGGAAAAAVTYTESIKAAAATAAGAAVSAIAGMTDLHTCPLPCPTPPHGPGVVSQGSTSVFFNNLPAARMGDAVCEACGGADPVAAGSPSVFIGDAAGG
ncbi:MAG: PAAR domain-containing protein [Phycisphaerae bacterium]|jgi:uncharacterized Zn-binding protein involved in type VI secretion